MYEPYTERLKTINKANFKLVFGTGFRKDSPFEQPYKALVSGIISYDILDGLVFGRVKLKNRNIEYPGVWGDKLFINIEEACQTISPGKRKIESTLVYGLIHQFVVFCHAIVKIWDDRLPVFNFYYYLQNACAHGNKFTITSYEGKGCLCNG